MNYHSTTVIPSLTPKWKKIISWLTVAVYLTQPSLAAAQVIADGSAPANQRPAIENAQNGVQVVQITAPSAAGVSRNQYLQFNVDQQGLILNNASSFNQTQLAGYIAGNTNLTGGSARIILNEVTGPGRSYLNGYTEIAGQKADLIIANPNGIIGNGFGFINAGRATLTTGIPVFGGSGSLEAFRVTQGQIAIEGAGFNANGTDRVDLISRAVAVNAGLWAKELNVVTGANQVDYNTLATNSITGTDQQPTVALDVGALGGMYANKIKLVGTERGLGVNSQGTLAASNGDLILSQEGKISLASNTSATGTINIDAKDTVSNSGTVYALGNTQISSTSAIENTGVLVAAKHTMLTANTIRSTGTVGAGINNDGSLGTSGNLTIQAGQAIEVTGQNLSAGNLVMQGASMNLTKAQTYAGGSIELKASAGDIDNTGGQIVANQELVIQTNQTFRNDQDAQGNAAETTAQQLTIQAQTISNKGGTLTQLGQNQTTLLADTFDNTGGTLATNGEDVQVKADVLINQQGQIKHSGSGHITVEASDMNNANGSLSTNGAITVTSQNLNNNQGTIAAQKQLTIKADAIGNQAGAITSAASIDITVQGSVNNQTGLIEAGQGLNVAGQTVNNQGGRMASFGQDGLVIQVEQELANNGGFIGGNGSSSIAADQITNQSGQIITKDQLNLTANSLNNSQGHLTAGNDLALNIHDGLSNHQGEILAGGDLAIQADSMDNGEGKLTANRDLAITAKQLSNDGIVAAGRDIVANLQQEFTNASQGKIQSNGSLTLNAGSVVNQGTVYAKGNAALKAGAAANNTGTIAAGNNLTITADTITSSGSFVAGLSSDGNVQPTGNLTLTVTGSLTATGENIAGANLSMQGTDIDLAGAKTYAGNHSSVKAAGSMNNTGGTIKAQHDLTLEAAGSLINDADIAGQGGQMKADKLKVSAQSISNRGGKFLQTGQDATEITAAGHIDNTQGMIATNGVDLTVSDNSFDNTHGQIQHAGTGQLTLQTVDDLSNTSGSIATNGKAELTASAIDNTAGIIFAQNKLHIGAESLSNASGMIIGRNKVELTANQASNDKGIIEAGKDLTITAQSLNNTEGKITSLDQSGLIVNVSQDLVNQAGLIGGNGDVSLTASNIISHDGQIAAKNNLTISNQDQLDNTKGNLSAGQDLILTQLAGTITNSQGTIQAGNDLTLAANTATITDGSFLANRDLSINSQNLSSDAIQAGRDVTLQIQNDFTNNAGGKVVRKPRINNHYWWNGNQPRKYYGS